jgi:hypothetical protein
MTTPTVWAQAKAEIQRRGWWKGDFYDRNQPKGSAPVCLAGAICAVTAGDPTNELHPRADQCIDRVMDRLGQQIAGWNDEPSRTVEDVYALLDGLDADDRSAA